MSRNGSLRVPKASVAPTTPAQRRSGLNASYLDSEDTPGESSQLIDSLLASLKNGQPTTPHRRILTPAGPKSRLPLPKATTPASSIRTTNTSTTTPKDLYPSLDALDTPSKIRGDQSRKIVHQALNDSTPSRTNVVPPPTHKTPTKSIDSILKMTSPRVAVPDFSIKFSAGLEDVGAKILEELKAKTAEKMSEIEKKGAFRALSPKSVVKLVEKKKSRFEEAHRKQFEKSGSILDHYAAKRGKAAAAKAAATSQPDVPKKRLKRTSSVAQLDEQPQTPRAMKDTPTIRFVQTTVTKRVKFSDSTTSGIPESPTPHSTGPARRPPPVPPKDSLKSRTPSRPGPNPHNISLIKSAPPKRTTSGSSLTRTISGRNLFPGSSRLTKTPAITVSPDKALPPLPQLSPKRRIQNALAAPMTAFSSRTASKIPIIEPGHQSADGKKLAQAAQEKVLHRDGEFMFRAVARNLKFPASKKAAAAQEIEHVEDAAEKAEQKVDYVDPFTAATRPTATSAAKRTTTTQPKEANTPARKRTRFDPSMPATPSRLPVPATPTQAQGNAITTPWREVKSRAASAMKDWKGKMNTPGRRKMVVPEKEVRRPGWK